MEEVKKEEVGATSMETARDPCPLARDPCPLARDPCPLARDPPYKPSFDPTPMIGIIKRKALIKDLAAAYHAECLTCCQELLDLQKNQEEPYVAVEVKVPNHLRKEITRPTKRVKKSR